MTRFITKQQLKVLHRLSYGGNFNEVAKEMFVERTTIKSHVQNARRNLNASTLAHAIGICYREGLFADMICQPCKERKHKECRNVEKGIRGDERGTWCDCQHRDPVEPESAMETFKSLVITE